MRLRIWTAALCLLAFFASGAYAGGVRTPPPIDTPPEHVTPQERISSGWFSFDPGSMILNQGINLLPGPTSALGGAVFYGGMSASANLIYWAAKISAQEGREMGNGEACAVFLNSLLIPVFTQMCLDAWAKVDLCEVESARDYPGIGERSVVPMAARKAWYEERYCGARPHYEYDIFLAEAGLPPRSQWKKFESIKATSGQVAKRVPHAKTSKGKVPTSKGMKRSSRDDTFTNGRFGRAVSFSSLPWPGESATQVFKDYKVL